MSTHAPSPVPSPPALPSVFVLGTHNEKKRREMEQLLAPLGIRLLTLSDVPNPLKVDESGTTFLENAILKARQQASHLGQWTVGEDSGLCVPYLDGAPGVYSARYAGPDATDAANNAKLLEALERAEGDQRRAFYVSTIALSDPQGNIVATAEGRCWGRILRQMRGTGGFGYDPLFEIPEYHRTFAELGPTVKGVLSHRGRAIERFRQALLRLAPIVEGRRKNSQ
ncbi:MAG: RdgB/HAM1 family non-canonical purine NTP pyrophosphatase [Planctomycetota bacterium]|nr:MAG: RdgB/HAM1 family non-canonical purine NTP pyrophosphatase [Planctomycetota bacterium]